MTLQRFATVLAAINLAVREESVLSDGVKVREKVVRLALQYGKRQEITQPEVSHVLGYALGTFLDRLPIQEKGETS